MYGCLPSCMYCTTCMSRGYKVRKEHQIPWKWNYLWLWTTMWYWGQNPSPLSEPKCFWPLSHLPNGDMISFRARTALSLFSGYSFPLFGELFLPGHCSMFEECYFILAGAVNALVNLRRTCMQSALLSTSCSLNFHQELPGGGLLSIDCLPCCSLLGCALHRFPCTDIEKRTKSCVDFWLINRKPRQGNFIGAQEKQRSSFEF